MQLWRMGWILCLVLAGCSTPYGRPEFAAAPGSSPDFRGIDGLLSTQRPLDVLLVHGMCTKDLDWGKEAAHNLFSMLGAGPAAAYDDARLEAVPGTGITVYQASYDTGRGIVRAKALRWSGLTTPLKRQLCYDKTHKTAEAPGQNEAEVCTPTAASPPAQAPAYPYTRAALNRVLKDTLMNDCLADALIYQGRARNEINLQMQQAILFALAAPGAQQRGPADLSASAALAREPLVVITSSLGSKILFDALYKMSQSTHALAAQRTVQRTSLVFMRANQMPILALADMDLAGNTARLAASGAGGPGAAYPPDPLAALLAAQPRALAPADGPVASAASATLQVVAFTDPNDLLSYILAPSPHAQSVNYAATDVVVSTATTYFGAVALPQKVHADYDTNVEVRRLMVCGRGALASC
jgi:hypothetical protein